MGRCLSFIHVHLANAADAILRKQLLTALLVFALSACGKPRATETAHWPDWRGPTADGHSAATGLPLHWSEKENILWKIPIHDIGHSTPVITGNTIWLTTATKTGDSLFAIGVDLASGEVVHDVELFKPAERQMSHTLNTFATPSPVVEEGRAYVHF